VQHSITHGNTGVLLLLVGFGWMLTHCNHLRGWDKEEVGSGGTVLLEQRAHGLFLADEHNLSRTV
jgi:hypothetical protein